MAAMNGYAMPPLQAGNMFMGSAGFMPAPSAAGDGARQSSRVDNMGSSHDATALLAATAASMMDPTTRKPTNGRVAGDAAFSSDVDGAAVDAARSLARYRSEPARMAPATPSFSNEDDKGAATTSPSTTERAAKSLSGASAKKLAARK